MPANRRSDVHADRPTDRNAIDVAIQPYANHLGPHGLASPDLGARPRGTNGSECGLPAVAVADCNGPSSRLRGTDPAGILDVDR